ncbi:UDP-N-acetylglucosamine 2-epimerase [Macrococcus armenti]|uniref:UDP-N-acetylglucosamine 2-epimerase n=1 Tax=Macrococcus armenti TaxID=2875764 RepID=UPI001CCAE09F|nr:UDP-N-acetylglucosamine 2-epimerase [Macrococcus armenti]UBH09365.1 UDP-N-acetylglucosamine 2-epimerase [Macrococcus armenti]
MIKTVIVTGTRAEYGLLKPLIEKINNSHMHELNLLVTGMHLAPEFGETINEIIEDGYPITEKVEILLSSDSDIGITKSMGLALISFGEILERISPDLVIILGDRFEILSVATAASVLKIPLVHIHGGETTEGAYDEAFRHSITKMSYLHFASTNTYKNRIIQLGEHPNRVFNVGALGVENIMRMDFLPKNEIYDLVGLEKNDKFFLVTFHPTTLEKIDVTSQIRDLLDTLVLYKKYKIVIAKANSDTNGRKINQIIDEYCDAYPNQFITFYSLGIKKYLSLMKLATLVVGNSSSGIIEAPSLKVPTINIGDRQKGRVRSDSIIDTKPYKSEIQKSIDEALFKIKNDKFTFINKYGNGQTSDLIFNQINKNFASSVDLKKRFYDLEVFDA